MTPSEVRGGAYYIQDFKELKGGREMTALVRVSCALPINRRSPDQE